MDLALEVKMHMLCVCVCVSIHGTISHTFMQSQGLEASPWKDQQRAVEVTVWGQELSLCLALEHLSQCQLHREAAQEVNSQARLHGPI